MKIAAAAIRFGVVLLITFGVAARAVSAADLSAPVTLVATPSLSGTPYAQTVLVAVPLAGGI